MAHFDAIGRAGLAQNSLELGFVVRLVHIGLALAQQCQRLHVAREELRLRIAAAGCARRRSVDVNGGTHGREVAATGLAMIAAVP